MYEQKIVLSLDWNSWFVFYHYQTISREREYEQLLDLLVAIDRAEDVHWLVVYLLLF